MQQEPLRCEIVTSVPFAESGNTPKTYNRLDCVWTGFEVGDRCYTASLEHPKKGYRVSELEVRSTPLRHDWYGRPKKYNHRWVFVCGLRWFTHLKDAEHYAANRSVLDQIPFVRNVSERDLVALFEDLIDNLGQLHVG